MESMVPTDENCLSPSENCRSGAVPYCIRYTVSIVCCVPEAIRTVPLRGSVLLVL